MMREEREKVMAMEGLSFDGNAMFHQIKNLKLYMLQHIRLEAQFQQGR